MEPTPGPPDLITANGGPWPDSLTGACSNPNQVNGTSCARRVLGAMWKELGDSVTWPAGAAKNPLPTINNECVSAAPYGAPSLSETMAAPGARRHDSSIDGRSVAQ